MTQNQVHFTIDFEILIPALVPEFRPKDFSKRKHQPCKQPLVTPAFANILNAVGDTTEG